MLFRLENAEATYQQLVNNMFKDQIGHNMEVYIDDMLVKSRNEAGHVVNLEEAFSVLWTYDIRLNSMNYACRVKVRNFLHFMVTSRGIDANSEKIQAILDVQPTKSLKDVQWLMWWRFFTANDQTVDLHRKREGIRV